ncbi:LOW QUALITY PROTEIN: uncharacterized protein LOC129321098 [Prosopis cineraria]|uniref:LOW QUALITY PROTEIN: uncharacterized protein LOC129321098 n=1 Tax=Prosopis cineraria TaxID=364024 RepID=UPI00241064B2|nr:LOW QUALITY PROTEIN: uncharacterized protein LOC129321098 [Prosopis cineraria]
MGESFFDLWEFLKKPSITETLVDILLCAVPIWFAVMVGLVIGWSWRPRWNSIVFLGFRCKFRLLWTAPPGFGARRLWLAFTALSAFSICRTIWSNFRGKGKGQAGQSVNVAAEISKTGEESSEVAGPGVKIGEKEHDIVNQNDLDHLLYLLEGKNGTMDWQSLMQISTPNMSYQVWRHQPQTGPLVYQSKTVFEDATPELVRDFFWDDEFRLKWDSMLAYCKILEECSHNGIMFSHWIKKFPFFCSDREYIIARRIWESGDTFYCVTKGVPYPSIPKRDKPRRVEHYFSSWVIKPVESRKDGQLSACEVTLLHYEDMGIPKDVEKLGARHIMSGVVKKLHSGLRAYQNDRKTEASLSRCAAMARITTKLSSVKSLNSLGPANEEEEGEVMISKANHKDHGIDWKWLVLGGTVALVLGIHGGAIGKGLLLGAGHRLARR